MRITPQARKLLTLAAAVVIVFSVSSAVLLQLIPGPLIFEAERALANFPRKEREAPAYLRPEPPLPLEEKPARPLRRRIWTPRPEEEYDRPAFLRKQAD